MGSVAFFPDMGCSMTLRTRDGETEAIEAHDVSRLPQNTRPIRARMAPVWRKNRPAARRILV